MTTRHLNKLLAQQKKDAAAKEAARSADDRKCTRIVTNLVKNLEQGVGQMPNFPWAVDTIMANPAYRSKDLVTDICNAFKSVATDALLGRTFTKTLATESERMAAMVQWFKGLQLNQDEVDRVMAIGVCHMSEFAYSQAKPTENFIPLVKALTWHMQAQKWTGVSGDANRMSFYALVKCCDPSVLAQAAATDEDRAMLLYTITGTADFLQTISSDKNRTKVFASDLGL